MRIAHHLGTCYCSYDCPPPEAWLVSTLGNCIDLCRHHLDWWFDSADADPQQEPLAWGWLDTPPTTQRALVLLPMGAPAQPPT